MDDAKAREELAKVPLVERQRYERFSAYLGTLAQFRYGYERLQLEPRDHVPTSKQFYFNSLMRYLYAIYLANGAAARLYEWLGSEWLREYGLSVYVERLDALFERKIGPKTFRERLLDVRGKLLDHYDYSGERVRELMREYDSANTGKEYGAAVDELLSLTNEIAFGAAAFIEEQKRGVAP